MTLPVWLGSNALVSINVVTLWQVKSVPGWVTGKPPQHRTRDPAHRSTATVLYICTIHRPACVPVVTDSHEDNADVSVSFAHRSRHATLYLKMASACAMKHRYLIHL